ncbi:MAG: UDP-N-acetylglucosamine 2-epimerase [Vicinamibacterales bacterium]
MSERGHGGGFAARRGAINVGTRQDGREHGANVIDVPAETGAILAALAQTQTAAFAQMLATIRNPYGDGRASERIVRVLTTADLGPSLLVKRASALLAD